MGRRSNAVFAALVVALVVLLVFQSGVWAQAIGTGEYNRTAVPVVDHNGTTAGIVDARVADTRTKRYVGLSETESLDPNEGMLFVHPNEGDQAYVMRDMAFPLDIIFADENGTITEIHHAPTPENTPEDDLRRYPGRGKYILEVNRGWTNETGVDVGDCLRIPENP